MSSSKRPGSAPTPAAAAPAAAPAVTAATDEKHLSTKLQSMKFMQRGADRAKVEAEKKLEKRLIGESHWRAVYDDSVFSKEKPRRARVVYESSYLKMPKDDADGGALVGRRSFKSFNKQTELASVEAETRFRDTQSAQLEKRTTIDDAEMAKTLASKRDTQDDRVQSLRETNKRPKRSRN